MFSNKNGSDSGSSRSSRAPRNVDSFGPAKDRIRDTLRWVIGVYGVIGSALIVGVSLADLEGLAIGTLRFWVAVTGAVLALAAVSWIVVMAARVFAGPGLSITDLAVAERRLLGDSEPPIPPHRRYQRLAKGRGGRGRREDETIVRYLSGQPFLYFGFGSISEITEKYLAHREDPESTVPSQLRRAVEQLRTVGGWQQTLRRFRQAMVTVLLGTLIVAMGLSSYVWAVSSSDPDSSASIPTDSLIQLFEELNSTSESGNTMVGIESFALVVDPDFAESYQDLIDSDCLGVGGLVVGDDTEEQLFVIPPSDSCEGGVLGFDPGRVVEGFWDLSQAPELAISGAFGSHANYVFVVDPDAAYGSWAAEGSCDLTRTITATRVFEGSGLEFQMVGDPDCSNLQVGPDERAFAARLSEGNGDNGETGIEP